MSRMSEFEGRSGAEYTMTVEKGKIREFGAAVGSNHPLYSGDDPVSPPTFLASSELWTTDASAPWFDEASDLSRVLHAGQTYVFHGPPPRAGTVLHCRQRIDRVYTKQGRRGGTLEFADIVTEYRDAAGRLLAESTATLVVTEEAPTASAPAG
ncbi:MaoC family dehydratase N-terminal domain-containing protein [Dactylosporangium sp. NPDC005555]|uniref:FAS1-like dehydratase domain-containing protein n=1 Tax=Dactylosporangium sp. NPDC005555 TaxID=3154889 RepID=UPI0033ADA845